MVPNFGLFVEAAEPENEPLPLRDLTVTMVWYCEKPGVVIDVVEIDKPGPGENFLFVDFGIRLKRLNRFGGAPKCRMQEVQVTVVKFLRGLGVVVGEAR